MDERSLELHERSNILSCGRLVKADVLAASFHFYCYWVPTSEDDAVCLSKVIQVVLNRKVSVVYGSMSSELLEQREACLRFLREFVRCVDPGDRGKYLTSAMTLRCENLRGDLTRLSFS
jgi:hypothetical protein